MITKQSISISLLLITLVLPVLWQTYDFSIMHQDFKLHPFRDIKYEPIVYISTLFDRVKPLIYLLAVIVFPPLSRTSLFKVYVLYEVCLITDFVLTYDQFEFRRYAIVTLGIWTSLYYFKYLFPKWK